MLMHMYLETGKTLIFKTAGMLPSDVIIQFNRVLGNSELGRLGEMPNNADGMFLVPDSDKPDSDFLIPQFLVEK